jgi:hypothetical protein
MKELELRATPSDSLEHLQPFCTPYLYFLEKKKEKTPSSSLVKELLKNKKLSNIFSNS